ncbi:hypothetical protein [Streptomyces sp. NPDC051183]|uniref:hypothetical protein n=1 Tax=Streptomyces sp. NPDC051183 TaxID=3155165 RepID=UPI0034286CB0
MRPTHSVGRMGKAFMACAVAAAVVTVGFAALPASAAPAKSAAAQVKPGDTCTAADLGMRHPYVTTTGVTQEVTGTSASLNCNRVQQGDGRWALKWIERPGSSSSTTRAALEAGAVALTGEQTQDLVQRPATTSGTTVGRGAQFALNCAPGAYRIDVPGRPLNWSAPLLADDGIRLRESTFFSAHLDNWRLCNVTENNGVLEASLWNWGNGGCATIPAGIAGQEQAYLTTVTCGEDDLQRFYIYRDVPGSSKIGVQNKYTGSMMGHDRYANGELIRQYSSGRQDGTGTYALTAV